MGEPFAEIVAAPADGHKLVCASLPDGCTQVRSPEELRRWLRRILVGATIAREFTDAG
jgi:hypothetical protein